MKEFDAIPLVLDECTLVSPSLWGVLEFGREYPMIPIQPSLGQICVAASPTSGEALVYRYGEDQFPLVTRMQNGLRALVDCEEEFEPLGIIDALPG